MPPVLPAVFLLMSPFLAVGGPASYSESPVWRAQVKAGELPPLEKRLPDEPLVVELGTYGIYHIGHYGGTLRFDAVDAPNVQGFTDTIVPFFNAGFGTFLPLAWKGYEVSEESRVWTFHLRKGMKWSDGHPYTTEDVMFWIDAIGRKKDLNPREHPLLTLNGKPALVEAVDPYTVRFRFEDPNLTFLSQIGMSERTLTGSPAHYLKQYHPDFAEDADLKQRLREEGMDTWTQLFEAKWDMVQHSNKELPSLLPWVVKDGIPNNPTRYVRNPYYWVVDADGKQLPYADDVRYTLVGNAERMKLRKVSGSVSVTPVQLDSAELVRRNAERGKIKWQLLPPPGDINSSTLCFNLQTPDPFKRKLINDRRFRFAMSLQISREVISEVLYNGLVHPQQIGVSDPANPWYNENLATAYLDYDLEEANRLLDEIGLTERDGQGNRVGPDGRRIVFSLQTVTHPEWSVVCEIISEGLPKVGLQANVRMVGWDGIADTIREGKWELFVLQCPMGYPSRWPSAMESMRPSGVTGYGWYEWCDSRGARGEEPPPLLKECWDWWQKARMAASQEQLSEAVGWLQQTAAEQLFGVGILSFPPQLRIHEPGVKNVPDKEPSYMRSALYLEKP